MKMTDQRLMLVMMIRALIFVYIGDSNRKATGPGARRRVPWMVDLHAVWWTHVYGAVQCFTSLRSETLLVLLWARQWMVKIAKKMMMVSSQSRS